jgi:hypothetical protein
MRKMPDLEKRLTTLEKQFRKVAEYLETLRGDIKGVSLILNSVGAAITADNKPLLRTIIKNLQMYEQDAMIYNDHELTLMKLRFARGFFEKLLEKADKDDQEPEDANVPRSPK